MMKNVFFPQEGRTHTHLKNDPCINCQKYIYKRKAELGKFFRHFFLIRKKKKEDYFKVQGGK